MKINQIAVIDGLAGCAQAHGYPDDMIRKGFFTGD